MSNTSLKDKFFSTKLARIVHIGALKSKPEITELCVRRFTLAERNAFIANAPKAGDNASDADKAAANLQGQLFLVTQGVCDADANAVFTQEDVEALQHEEAATIDELSKAVMDANGMSAKSVDAATKN